jgi:hypothetical protein
MRQVSTVILLLSLLIGCSQKEPSQANYDAIKVGMTYDEVVEVMGRPEEIVKGVYVLSSVEPPAYRQFADRYRQGADYMMRFLEMVRPHLIDNPKNLISSPVVESQGQLVQTTWFMPKAPLGYDTLKLALPAGDWAEPETTHTTNTTYWRWDNGEWVEIYKWAYGKFEGEKYKTITRPVTIVKPSEFVVDIKWVDILITYKYAIIFDSSSGRVVTHTSIPISATSL